MQPTITRAQVLTQCSQVPITHIIDVDVGFTDDVVGGVDGKCQKKTTNLQEGVTKEDNLAHVLHECLGIDHSSDLRVIDNSTNS